jgi:TolA-binding protein
MPFPAKPVIARAPQQLNPTASIFDAPGAISQGNSEEPGTEDQDAQRLDDLEQRVTELEQKVSDLAGEEQQGTEDLGGQE